MEKGYPKIRPQSRESIIKSYQVPEFHVNLSSFFVDWFDLRHKKWESFELRDETELRERERGTEKLESKIFHFRQLGWQSDTQKLIFPVVRFYLSPDQLFNMENDWKGADLQWPLIKVERTSKG